MIKFYLARGLMVTAAFVSWHCAGKAKPAAAVAPAATASESAPNKEPKAGDEEKSAPAVAEYKPSVQAQAHFDRGSGLLVADKNAALQAFMAAAADDSRFYLAHYNAAVLLENEGRAGEAKKFYEKALAAKADFGPAAAGYFALVERSGDGAAAEKGLREFVVAYPNSPEPRAILAQLLGRGGRFDEAHEQAIAVLKLDERNAGAMLALGMVYRRQNKFELATLALTQSFEINANLGEAYNELGLVLLAQGEKAKAVQAFEKAAQISPHVASIHNNLGVLRNEVGAFQGAIAALETATKLNPERAEYYLNLGNALRGEQRYADAEAAYKKALALNETPQALFNLGVLYLDNELGPDPMTRYRTCIEYLNSYVGKAKPDADDQAKVNEYIQNAQKGIENEEKRLLRDKQRAEKDAAKKKAAAEKAAAEGQGLSTENGKTETGKTEAGKTETGKTEAGKTEAGKTETGKTEAGKTETGKTETGKTETGKTETGKTETGKTETGKTETGKTETVAADPEKEMETVDSRPVKGKLKGKGKKAKGKAKSKAKGKAKGKRGR